MKGAGSAARAQTVARGPVSVALPDALRGVVQTEAKKRGLKLSTTVRVLVAERMEELAEAEHLSRVEQWQRAEAWATWELLKAGDRREASKADLDADFEEALGQAPRPRAG